MCHPLPQQRQSISIAIDHVIGENGAQLLAILGLEQLFDGSSRQALERLVRRCEDGERSLAEQRLGQSSGIDGREQRGELPDGVAISPR